MRSKPYVNVMCDECECSMDVPLDEGVETVMVAGAWQVVDGRDLCDECAPVSFAPHLASPDCWCHPTLTYVNKDTGAKHWLHHEPN